MIDISENDKVNDFLADLQITSPDQVDVVLCIRELFLQANTELEDTIKYGGLVFLKAGVLIGGIFAYKNHISIEFGEGATFSDPSGVLEGGGKHRRHLKIRTAEDVDNKDCAYFIAQAVT